MKYGRIAGNSHINALIYRCFEQICEKDQRAFLKKFRDQPQDSNQIMHTFRELLLGAYLSSNGFRVRHNYALGAKTPDWCILDDKSGVIGIIELVNFHIDKLAESVIEQQIKLKGMALYWRDQNKDNIARLYQCIWKKARVYQALVKKLKTPYIVSIFGEFQAAVDFEEVRRCLFDKTIGLFQMYPELSGVLYFQESFGRYLFNYTFNPNSLQVIELPSCAFPSEGF